MNKVVHVSNVEWGLILGALGMMDLVQILLDFFLIGLGANRFIDIFVGLSLGFYTTIRDLMDQRIFISIIATFVGEEVPLLDIAPFWILDGWYVMRRHKAKEKEYKDYLEAEAQKNTEAQMLQKIAA